MRQNENVIQYPGVDGNTGYRVKIFESIAQFRHREYFEHRHSDFELSCIVSGSGLYRMNNKVCEIHTGDLFIFGTNQIHCITDIYNDESLILLNIQFEPRMIWSPLSNLLNTDYLFLFNGRCEKFDSSKLAYTTIIDNMYKILQETKDKRIGYQTMVRSYMEAIFTYLLRDCNITQGAEMSLKRRQCLINIENAMKYIDENISQQITLDDLAKRACVSRTYFPKIFFYLNGLKPWDYITIKRIEASKEFLINTDYSIAELAGMCGYNNYSNFNILFNRTVGMSPMRYRKSHKQ